MPTQLSQLLDLVEKCADTEAQLWQLLYQSTSKVTIAHSKLVMQVQEFRAEIESLQLEEKIVSQIPELKQVRSKISNELHNLIALLIEQQRKLHISATADVSDIAAILNGNKSEGVNLSESSRTILWLTQLIQNDLASALIKYSAYNLKQRDNTLLDRRIEFFVGAPRDKMPQLRAQGYRPASFAEIMATRVEVYRRLLAKGLPSDEFKKDVSFQYWFCNPFTSGDAFIYTYDDGKIAVGRNSVWLCDTHNADLGFMFLPSFDEGIAVGRREISKMSKDQVLQNPIWQILAGDIDLLKDFVHVVFELDNSKKMRIFFTQDTTSSPKGILLNADQIRGGDGLGVEGCQLHHTTSRLIGVKY